MATKHRFVDLPRKNKPVHLYERSPNGNMTKFRQVLWGDYLHTKGPADRDGWVPITWAPNNPTKRRELFIQEQFVTTTRPLEMVFVDVGQGDGAVLVSPERNQQERIIVIDAGEYQNMGDFLNRRFGSYRNGFNFHAAVITHPDNCLLYTSPSPRDQRGTRMPSSA